MAVYVDELRSWRWRLRGRTIQNCHLFSDKTGVAGLEELYACGKRIGMRRSWLRHRFKRRGVPHFDLTMCKRAQAVRAGAVEVDRDECVRLWRARWKVELGEGAARGEGQQEVEGIH